MHDQLRASGRKLSPRLVHSYQVSPPILLAQQRLRAERRGEARLDPLLGRLLEAMRNQQERSVVEASADEVDPHRQRLPAPRRYRDDRVAAHGRVAAAPKVEACQG